MKVNGKAQRTIWTGNGDDQSVYIIDQRCLPHEFVAVQLRNTEETVIAIREMWVRGAPLIGSTAAFGMYFALKESRDQPDPQTALQEKAEQLLAARPTAVNLRWAVRKQMAAVKAADTWETKIRTAWKMAGQIAEEDVETCRSIGVHGLPLLEALSNAKGGKTLNILTHCNAGWLATVDWGTATSPIYHAFEKGIDLHVWVDETRPRNQGARLTAWELAQHGVPHTVIADNTGGHLMQHGRVDVCIVGTDRTTRTGDVANKIGTYLKALAAFDNGIPFYVALPSTTIDWEMRDGLKEIPIEMRGAEEVRYIQGYDKQDDKIKSVLLTPEESPAANYAFDVTPARLVTGLITEKGVCNASEEGLTRLFDR